jgi:hypothetical protein
VCSCKTERKRVRKRSPLSHINVCRRKIIFINGNRFYVNSLSLSFSLHFSCRLSLMLRESDRAFARGRNVSIYTDIECRCHCFTIYISFIHIFVFFSFLLPPLRGHFARNENFVYIFIILELNLCKSCSAKKIMNFLMKRAQPQILSSFASHLVLSIRSFDFFLKKS